MNSDDSLISGMRKNMEMKSPIFKTALTSKDVKVAGKAIANHLVESGVNIATAPLMGNNFNDNLKRELEASQQNAIVGVKMLKNSLNMKRANELKVKEKLFKKKKKMDLILKSLSENLMILQKVMGMVEDLKDQTRKKKKAKIYHLSDGRVLKWE